MKSDKNVLDALEKEYGIELQSSALYTTHAGILKIWGYNKLADRALEEAKEEREHADKALRRILELNPAYPIGIDNKAPQKAPQTVSDVFKQQEELETKTQNHLKDSILIAETADDYLTREVLIELLEPTEEALVWLMTQQKLISDIGMQNYLQAQI